MSVKVRWRQLGSFEDIGWKLCRCLYAYTNSDSDEILYIGKADRASIHQRWKAKDKQKLFRDLEQQRQIFEHIVFIGELELDFGKKFSWQLLSDVESVLIFVEQPWGNIQSKNSIIVRKGLQVNCSGNWIGQSKKYLVI